MDFLDKMKAEADQKYQLELSKMRLQWEGIKLQAEAAKLEQPELAEQLDNYLELTKTVLFGLLESLAENEEELKDLENDAKFIFGEV